MSPRFFRNAEWRPNALELFFDLVFVLCIAQLARLVRDDPTRANAATAAALFVPIWWTWTGVTFCTDRFPADAGVARTLVLLAAAAAGTMALAVTGIPGPGAAWFAVGYATVRLVLVVLYVRAARTSPAKARQPRWYATAFALTAILWLVSVAVPAPGRWMLWTVAVAIDIGVPALIDRRIGLLPVDVHHLPDRFGAFVIIVLGESVVTTATLTLDTGVTVATALLLAEAFLLTAVLWWGFFDRGAWTRRYERLAGDGSGRLANIVCAYLHFPLVAGITVVAVGAQLAVTHPADRIGTPAALALAGGSAVYLLTLNAMTFVLGIPRAESLARGRLVLVALLVVVAGAGRAWSNALYLAAVIAALTGHVIANLQRARAYPTSPP